MIRNLTAYPAYKDSGVPWLGRVPEHWELKPLKRWVRINESNLPETTPADYEFKYIDIGTVGTGFLIREPQQMRFGGAPSRARRVLRRGDTIVSTVRTYLKAVYHVARDANALVCSTGFVVLTAGPGTHPKYVSYLAKSSFFIDCICAESVGTAYPAIAESRLRSFRVPVPPFPEQTSIVRFLEWTEQRIRRLIRARKKRIKLLEEYKEALIHQVVTGQIDVQTGKPYPAYKPSGVEWLGKLPEHWEVRRLGSVMQIQNGATPSSSTPEYWDGDIVWVTPDDLGKLKGRYIYDSSRLITLEGYNACGTTLAPAGSIVISTRAPIGHLGILQVAACTNQGCRLLVPQVKTISEYLYYVLFAARPSLEALGQGSTFLELSRTNLRVFRVPFPPLPEQFSIVEHLDAQTAKINAAIAASRKEIELLREYLTRLISDVVTGKVDVREVAAQLPEEPAEEDEMIGDEIVEYEAEGGEADNETVETFFEEEVEP